MTSATSDSSATSATKKTQILICVGTGGVGKTTLAAGFGVWAAQNGLKVLVLTIDPSKRLATTLGIEGKNDTTRVPHQNFSGELFASIVDAKKVFDDFIIKAAKKTGSSTEILNNKLYQQLSTGLSGSQEFTSLEKLYTEYESGKFDLIILDTPPAKHAIDFLQAPQKLASLFNEGIARWFRNPHGKNASIFSKILNAGTRQVLKILETLTGSQFIAELSDFFQNIEKWRSELQNRNVLIHRLLVSPATQFCLVTSFDLAKLKEAEHLLQHIRRGGYNLRSIFINRAFPEWMQESSKEPTDSQSTIDADPKILNLYKKMKSYYTNQVKLYDQFNNKFQGEIIVHRIPHYDEDICDLAGLEKLADLIRRMPKCSTLLSR